MFEYSKNWPEQESIADALFLPDLEFVYKNIAPHCISLMPSSVEQLQEMQFLLWMNEIQPPDETLSQRRLNNDG